MTPDGATFGCLYLRINSSLLANNYFLEIFSFLAPFLVQVGDRGAEDRVARPEGRVGVVRDGRAAEGRGGRLLTGDSSH